MFYGMRTDQEKDRLRRVLAELKEIYPIQFQSDMLISIDRCMSFLRDEPFMVAFKKNTHNAQENSLIWRLHVLVWAARQSAHLDGDFVECGVFRGFCSNTIIDCLDFAEQHSQRTFYLYDTFQGMPHDNDHPNPTGAYQEENLYGKVCERFSPYPNVRVIQGIVPESFQQQVPEKVAFLHLDMNSAPAEIAALEVLFDRIVPGGAIVFDDYGWNAYKAQQRAESAFMAERGYMIMELPTGQGLMIKR